MMQSEMRPLCYNIFLFLTVLLLVNGCGDDDSTGPQSAGPNTTVITVASDGSARDGLYEIKDGIPDYFSDGSGIQVLNVDRAVQPFEDRGIFEFDLSSMPDTFVTAILELSVANGLGPYPFTLVLANYVGDGVASINDFSAGVDVASVEYNGEATIAISVTSSMELHMDAGDSYAGFVLRFDPATTIEINGPFVYLGSLESPPAATLKIARPD